MSPVGYAETGMTNEVDKLSNRRAFLMMLLASAFLIWQVPSMDYFDGLASGDIQAIDIIGMVGGAIWVTALVILFVTGGRKGGTPEARAALEDELVKDNRARAFKIGYFVMLAIAALMFGLSIFNPVTGRDSAHMVLIAGVVAPMYTFAFLERRNA